MNPTPNSPPFFLGNVCMHRRVKDLAFAARVDQRDLQRIVNRIEAGEPFYYQKVIDSKPDKKRVLHPPVRELKRIQRGVLEAMRLTHPLRAYQFGGVPNRSHKQNARQHQGNTYCLRTDYKDFFNQVGRKQVYSTLSKIGFYPDVARAITLLTTNEGVLPMGAPTSTYLAGLYLDVTIGNELQGLIDRGYKVSVFVDDITISSQADFKNHSEEMIQLLSQVAILNRTKTTYGRVDTIITGFKVRTNSTRKA